MFNEVASGAHPGLPSQSQADGAHDGGFARAIRSNDEVQARGGVSHDERVSHEIADGDAEDAAELVTVISPARRMTQTRNLCLVVCNASDEHAYAGDKPYW